VIQYSHGRENESEDGFYERHHGGVEKSILAIKERDRTVNYGCHRHLLDNRFLYRYNRCFVGKRTRSIDEVQITSQVQSLKFKTF